MEGLQIIVLILIGIFLLRIIKKVVFKVITIGIIIAAIIYFMSSGNLTSIFPWG